MSIQGSFNPDNFLPQATITVRKSSFARSKPNASLVRAALKRIVFHQGQMVLKYSSDTARGEKPSEGEPSLPLRDCEKGAPLVGE